MRVFVGNVMARNAKPETGVRNEMEADIPANANKYAYADDGEHATVWAIEYAPEGEGWYHVKVFRCEAGLAEEDREATQTMRSDKDIGQFAAELANDDPEAAIEEAREFWEGR